MKAANYVAPEATIISIEIEDAILQMSGDGSLGDFGEGNPLNME